jgi:hypothetical protein
MQINELSLIDNMEYKITCFINNKSSSGLNLHNLFWKKKKLKKSYVLHKWEFKGYATDGIANQEDDGIILYIPSQKHNKAPSPKHTSIISTPFAISPVNSLSLCIQSFRKLCIFWNSTPLSKNTFPPSNGGEEQNKERCLLTLRWQKLKQKWVK